MNISVIGTGYVGLVTGACFSEMGNTVICVDIDENKIEGLKKGIMPIYEPGLKELVTENYKKGRLVFTTSIEEAVTRSKIHFIAVGTPAGETGSADLQYVLAAAKELGRCMSNDYNVVVDKSTVPVGTSEKVQAAIAREVQLRGSNVEFDVVSNPEFLKEGAAIDDFMSPDRIIIGTNNEKANKIMRDLYGFFTHKHDRIITMGVRDAEMTKYAANAMLATKISFMNEMATLCDSLNVDVENVRTGIGADSRIGYHFIYPGCGYGGSCFPKDVQALQQMALEVGIEPLVLNAVEERNARQKTILFSKMSKHYSNELEGKTFAFWGLAFKPGTDDMREAPSLVLIKDLLNAGARVKAFDPAANKSAKAQMKEDWLVDKRVILSDSQYEVLDGADAMVLLTEWKPFRNPDFEQMKNKLRTSVIFDGRNQYNKKVLKELGFVYYGIGR